MVNTEPPESASLPSQPDATSPIHLLSEPRRGSNTKLRGDVGRIEKRAVEICRTIWLYGYISYISYIMAI